MKLAGIAPIVAVADPDAAAEWLIARLGFEQRSADDGNTYRLVARDGAALVLVGPGDRESLAATAKHSSAYVWVEDLDAFWAEIAPRLADLPEGSVRAPFQQPYGMRECHVKGPDGVLLMFGEDATE
ncbi:MAG: VOC family protein [Pseudomonadota bacterium]